MMPSGRFPFSACLSWGGNPIARRFVRRCILSLVLVCLALPGRGQTRADLQAWGRDAMRLTERELKLPERKLYVDGRDVDKPTGDNPAFMWGCGVQLSALAAWAKEEPKAGLEPLRDFVAGMQVYWNSTGPVAGYDVLPVPKPIDRYYDDNEWVVLALCEAFEVTHDSEILTQAEATFRYVASGESDVLGGGIWWREAEKTSKNTCSNAPAIVCALRLYQLTHKVEYRDTALRLYAWTNAHLQDADGLYWDNLALDSTVGKAKFTYNTALMLRANVLLYRITRTPQYLTEARRIAHAAQPHWFLPTGAVRDDGKFAFMLCESLLFLAQNDRADRDHWHETVRHTLAWLHEKLRDANGHYPVHWDSPPDKPLPRIALIDQASAARLYLYAAQFL